MKARSLLIAVATICVHTTTAKTIIVNSTADAAANDGQCTLREAITAANTNTASGGMPGECVAGAAGLDTINFKIPGSGVHTIAPASNLPVVTDPVMIDGYSQPGASANTHGPGAADNAVLRIVLNGVNSDPNLGQGDGLVIAAGGSTVRGLVINGFARAPTGGGGRAIVLQGKGASTIQGNFIGTNAQGTAAAGNGEAGVLIDNVADNIVGGVNPADRNVISGNAFVEVEMRNPGATNNKVLGNFIGTNAAGTATFGSGFVKAVLVNQAPHNTIGGTIPGARNVIAEGLSHTGVELSSNDNTVQGNFIGTDLTGQVALPNSVGIFVINASGNVIGGTVAGAGNLISGSTNGIHLGYGITVTQPNFVFGNFIGTDVTGTKAIGNVLGVNIGGEPAPNVLGGPAAGAGNLISGNVSHGVSLTGRSRTVLQGNLIGTQVDGVGPLGNGAIGIVSTSLDNVIGGTALGEGNVIAFNGGAGVAVTSCCGGEVGMGNAILSNSISSNAGLGVDLGGDGVTPNDTGDADTGPNNLQNFPVLKSVTNAGGKVKISGTLTSTPSTTFRLEFFRNDAGDGSGFGEGEVFLGSRNVLTNQNGNVSFNAQFPATTPAQRVTATATDPLGNTSEFSAALGQLLNISTRLRVQTGDNVLIAGFIVTGADPKKVIARALGPSITGVSDPLQNPTLELHDKDGPIAFNDNWKDTQENAIKATGIPPPNNAESAIVRTLAAGSAGYTAVVRGKDGSIGTGLVEVYDLDQAANSELANISTRGLVEGGNNLLIGGFISGNGITRVIVRALGPSLAGSVSQPLPDPLLELHDGNGGVLATNDNWRDTQETEIMATQIPPPDNAESAIVATLPPGGYTAVVRDVNGAIGVALVEVYSLN